jgi:hypothetical protein
MSGRTTKTTKTTTTTETKMSNATASRTKTTTTTSGHYVTVLRGTNTSWTVAYRQGNVIRHDRISPGTADEARAEAQRMFGRRVKVWVPSTGEPMPEAKGG